MPPPAAMAAPHPDMIPGTRAPSRPLGRASTHPMRVSLGPAGRFSHRGPRGERHQPVLAGLLAHFCSLCFQPLHLLLVLLHSVSHAGIDHGLAEDPVLRCIRCGLQRGREDWWLGTGHL